MSFNVQQPHGTNWDARRDSAIKLIKDVQPDILGTQEAVNFQRDYLIENLNIYNWYGTDRDGNNNGEGCWIFYKKENFLIDSAKSGNFWFSKTPDTPSRFGGKYNRLCTYIYLEDIKSGEKLFIFNIHNYMPEENDLRMKAIKLFIEKVLELSKSENMVIMGDFNSPEEDDVTHWIKKSKENPLHLIDTYRELYPQGIAITGFGTKLDYIYVPEKQTQKVYESYIIKNNHASDHMAIVAEMIF